MSIYFGVHMCRRIRQTRLGPVNIKLDVICGHLQPLGREPQGLREIIEIASFQVSVIFHHLNLLANSILHKLSKPSSRRRTMSPRI